LIIVIVHVIVLRVVPVIIPIIIFVVIIERILALVRIDKFRRRPLIRNLSFSREVIIVVDAITVGIIIGTTTIIKLEFRRRVAVIIIEATKSFAIAVVIIIVSIIKVIDWVVLIIIPKDRLLRISLEFWVLL